MRRTVPVPVTLATPESFAPYGHVLDPATAMPGYVGPGYSTTRFPLQLGGLPDLTLLRHPFDRIACHAMERHTQVTELRVPLEPRASIVFVAAPGAAPAPGDVRGFLVDGATAILIARECWHSPSYPLDPRGASFVLLSDAETEAELETAGQGATSRFTHVADWGGEVEFIPDLSGLGRPNDRLRPA
ncbi:MAG: ureidoglycolate lyase [Pikeienuella sp.]|uniref:ureidoglycolate lyase n=1 Tax=Pikeienuella sp. TaxID=2831957 RepID=UPI00391BC0D5